MQLSVIYILFFLTLPVTLKWCLPSLTFWYFYPPLLRLPSAFMLLNSLPPPALPPCLISSSPPFTLLITSPTLPTVPNWGASAVLHRTNSWEQWASIPHQVYLYDGIITKGVWKKSNQSNLTVEDSDYFQAQIPSVWHLELKRELW